METNSTQQEILLVTGTSFSSREFCERNGLLNNNLSEKEKLADACWNGLLPQMLPEIFEPESLNKLCLWEVREATSFIEVELGNLHLALDKEFSIDPYTFLEVRILS